MKKIRHDGIVVLFTTIILLIIGLISVFSASKVWAQYLYLDKFYYLKRQALFMFLGIILMIVGIFISKRKLYKYSNLILFLLMILSLLLLILL